MSLNYQIYPPPPELQAYVRAFWVLEGSPDYIHRSMADACVTIVFHYRGKFNRLAPSGVSREGITSLNGPCQQFTRYHTQEGFGLFGVYLYPYALRDILGLAPESLTGASFSLPEALGEEGRDLEDKVLQCSNNSQRVNMLCTYFLKKLGKRRSSVISGAMYYAMQFCFARKGQVDIRELASLANLSRRQLERKFKQATGLSPKRFCQLLRFQAALKEYPSSKKSLVAIALEYGYYDQSHFIQEFKRFSGYTPGQWFLGDAEGQAYRELKH